VPKRKRGEGERKREKERKRIPRYFKGEILFTIVKWSSLQKPILCINFEEIYTCSL
jgi:hypothetical protein